MRFSIANVELNRIQHQHWQLSIPPVAHHFKKSHPWPRLPFYQRQAQTSSAIECRRLRLLRA